MVEPEAGTPEHPHQMGKKDPENGRYVWDFSVIKGNLMNPVYTGAIASQKTEYRFKIGTIRDKKPEDWIVVEGRMSRWWTKGLCDCAGKTEIPPATGQIREINLFAGLIKCGECGKALTIRTTHEKFPKRIFSCKTYNAYGKQHCTQHRIEFDTLYSLC